MSPNPAALRGARDAAREEPHQRRPAPPRALKAGAEARARTVGAGALRMVPTLSTRCAAGALMRPLSPSSHFWPFAAKWNRKICDVNREHGGAHSD